MSKVFNKKICFIVAIVVGVFLLNSCQKEFTITVVSNDASMGTVTGGGAYKKGTIIKLEAIAKSGYQFEKWTDGKTSNPRTITVEENAIYTAIFVMEDNGGEKPTYEDAFSVSATQKVYFSPGNLQWSATNGGYTATTHEVINNGLEAGTWRFSPNQWDTIGANNKYISATYTGWIDLFGLGTSGYNNNYPYITSITSLDCDNNDISGTNYDWGVYNAIYNPKTQTIDPPDTWRTLTIDEWMYLLNTRITSSGIRYAKANVHGVNGIIIVPDNWSTSVYTLFRTNLADADYIYNIINNADWINLEVEGCVFLPASGYRYGSSFVNYVGYNGNYWSTSLCGRDEAFFMYFDLSDVNWNGYLCEQGYSVRLVKNAE